jgi:PAS domain S-box-containing protein
MATNRILIVEDEPSMAGILKAGLKNAGYVVVGTVSTGEDAIQEAWKHQPDLVLMDIHLQGALDGIEAATQIRLQSNIPAIFVTGDLENNLLERSKDAQPLGFVHKPFSLKELQQAMETSLHRYSSIQKSCLETLQPDEINYQGIFENAVEGIFRFSCSGRYLNVNPSFAKMLGYESPQELLDSAIDAQQSFVDPKIYKQFIHRLDQAGFVENFEFEACRRDGRRIWLSQNTRAICNASGAKSHYEGIVHNISSKIATNKETKHILSRQTAILAAVPDIIIEVDAGGICTWANNKCFDFIDDKIIGTHIADHFENPQSIADALKEILTNENKLICLNNWKKDKNGDMHLLSWRCHVLKDYTGNITGMLASARDITEEHLAEDSLRKSESRFRLITEHIDEVFWIADFKAGRTIYVSPAFEKVWGFSARELYQSVYIFSKGIHPEDRERVLSAFSMDLNGQPFDIEYRIVRPDGVIRQIWDRGFPVLDNQEYAGCYVGVTKDVTELRKAEYQLNKSRESLHQIINCIGDPIFVKDEKHRFLLVNDANCEFLGLPRTETLGKTLSEIIPNPMNEELCRQETLVFETGQPYVSIDELDNISGRHFTVMTKKTLLPGAYGDKMIVGVVRDITEMKKAERERALMEIQLHHALKLETIGQLAAGIAHEINTPAQYVGDNMRFLQDSFTEILEALKAYNLWLQAYQGNTPTSEVVQGIESKLKDFDLDYLLKEVPSALTQSLEGLGRIATIVRAMKEFSHPGSEDKQAIDLNHAIENTITVCRNEWKYVADMVLELEPALPLVSCMPGEINQVILNLVVNAAQAIKEGQKAEDYSKGTITIQTSNDEHWAEIRIRDTGPGIPEKYWNKIFTPFFTTKAIGKGTGQGLAISHSVIVNKHGGTIQFESEIGKGTVFIIRLPLNSSMESQDKGVN